MGSSKRAATLKLLFQCRPLFYYVFKILADSSGSVWRLTVSIPKGFKLIAVGERCAIPTDSIDRETLTLKGSHSLRSLTLSGVRRCLVGNSVGVAQRSPTAINLNPFGIGSDQNSNWPTTCRICRWTSVRGLVRLCDLLRGERSHLSPSR